MRIKIDQQRENKSKAKKERKKKKKESMLKIKSPQYKKQQRRSQMSDMKFENINMGKEH